MFDRWSQAVVWDVEIDERPAHEDPGSMNLLVESVLAIYEENVETLPGKESSTLKPGKSRTDDRDVIKRSHAGMLSCRRECRQVLYVTNPFVVFLAPFCGSLWSQFRRKHCPIEHGGNLQHFPTRLINPNSLFV